MKITVYTIPDCQFSKQEKEYLTANKLQYEEKNLEANREFLTEMMTLSNNFAGTPVTKIEKDDGQIAVLKGFTMEEFDKTLGLTQPAKPTEPALSEMNAQVAAPTPAPVPQPPQPPQPPAPPQPKAEQPMAETPPSPAVASAKAGPTQQTDDQLKSVLSDLQQKSTEPAAPQSPPATPPANLPNIPDFE